MGGEERADIRTGGENKIEHDHLAAQDRRIKAIALLVLARQRRELWCSALPMSAELPVERRAHEH